ncbi:hypothetical protein C8Q80DRAFT_1122786 [Daedaleopsis nitida]|nr:hypothetical protein C8Q80DRAFT_1122786 [Daedaleopsis nitida]
MLRKLFDLVALPFGPRDTQATTGNTGNSSNPPRTGGIQITLDADGSLCIQPEGHGPVHVRNHTLQPQADAKPIPTGPGSTTARTSHQNTTMVPNSASPILSQVPAGSGHPVLKFEPQLNSIIASDLQNWPNGSIIHECKGPEDTSWNQSKWCRPSTMSLEYISCDVVAYLYNLDRDGTDYSHSRMGAYRNSPACPPPGGRMSRSEEDALDQQVTMRPEASVHQLRTGGAVPGSVPLPEINPTLANPRTARHAVGKALARVGLQPSPSAKGGLALLHDLGALQAKHVQLSVNGFPYSGPGLTRLILIITDLISAISIVLYWELLETNSNQNILPLLWTSRRRNAERRVRTEEASRFQQGCLVHFQRSAMRLKKDKGIIPPHLLDTFKECLNVLLSPATTQLQYRGTLERLHSSFPAVLKGWIDWWARPKIATMIFPACRGIIDYDFRESEVPLTSNPIETQHSLLHHATGTQYDLIPGIEALVRHAKQLQAQYDAAKASTTMTTNHPSVSKGAARAEAGPSGLARSAAFSPPNSDFFPGHTPATTSPKVSNLKLKDTWQEKILASITTRLWSCSSALSSDGVLKPVVTFSRRFLELGDLGGLLHEDLNNYGCAHTWIKRIIENANNEKVSEVFGLRHTYTARCANGHTTYGHPSPHILQYEVGFYDTALTRSSMTPSVITKISGASECQAPGAKTTISPSGVLTCG